MKIDIHWVKAAQSALVESGIVKNTRQQTNQDSSQATCASYPKAFKGYISSLAASIVQSGLVPALSIYESDNKEEEVKKNGCATDEGNYADNNRALLVDAIAITLQKQKVLTERVFPLSNYIVNLSSDEERTLLQHSIHQSLIALKLALRMYQSNDEVKRNDQVTSSVLSEKIPSIDVSNHSIQPADNKYGNVGWLFYKDLYRSFKHYKYNKIVQGKNKPALPEEVNDVTEEHQEMLFSAKMETLFSSTFSTRLQKANKRVADAFSKQQNYHFFILKTHYPGLLSGTGLSHGVKLKSDVKVGFQFDYTTGLPYIPGPSIKGILRCVFPDKKATDEYNEPRIAYLQTKLKQIQGAEWTGKMICSLGEQLFEDAANNFERDVFLDALMVEANSKGCFLGNDYITPHKSPFLDPVPIQFLKVLPEVQFRISFLLNAQSSLSVEERKKLYMSILLDVGMGAKTHVGYGHMQLVSEVNQPYKTPGNKHHHG